MVIYRGIVLLSLLGLTSIACQTSISRQYWEQSQKNGKASGPRDPTLLHTIAIVDPDPDIGQFCSGVMIDKRHILTAASCFNDEKRIPFVLMERNYEPGIDFSEHSTLHRIEVVAVHSRYQKEKSAAYDKKIAGMKDPKQIPSPGAPLFDLAIAILENDIIAPYQAIKSSTRIDTSKKIMGAAYGCPSALCDQGDTELHKSEMTFVKILSDAHLLVATGDKSHCVTGLGGPRYMPEAKGLSLLMIATTGVEACESGVAVDTLVNSFQPWIDKGKEVLGRPMMQVDGYRVIDYTHPDEESGT